MLDQDSIPEKDCVERLCGAAERLAEN